MHKAVIFDFDNTIVHMPTKIKLFNQVKNDYIGLSTAQFARYKHLIGVKGYLQNCQIDENSFEEFRTFKNKSFLLDDMVKILKSDCDSWQAAYYNYFIEMLSQPESAENVYILTARGHDKEEFMEALRLWQKFLKSKNIKIYLPRMDHLFLVGGMKNIALAKASIIESIVLKESSENTSHIEFADDDHENISKAAGLLQSLQSNFKDITFSVTHVLEKSIKKIFIKKDD